MYHRVLPPQETTHNIIQPGMYVSNKTFEEHLRFLQSYCQIISFPEFLQRWNSNEWNLHERYCVLTFDDGWKDNYTYAYPLVKKYHVPITIFLTTSYIGTTKWYWPEKVSFFIKQLDFKALPIHSQHKLLDKCEALGINTSLFVSSLSSSSLFARRKCCDYLIEHLKKYNLEQIGNFLNMLEDLTQLTIPEMRLLLDWKEVKEMSNHGVYFGSHCNEHRILTLLSPEEIRKELSTSLETIMKKEINVLPILSYPNGAFNNTIIKLAQTTGYVAAVTTQHGWVTPGADNPFTLRRIGVHEDISSTTPLLALYLSGIVN